MEDLGENGADYQWNHSLSLNEMGTFSFSWDTRKMREDIDPNMLDALLSYWPIKCLPHKGNNDRWPGKILVTQNFTKSSRGTLYACHFVFLKMNWVTSELPMKGSEELQWFSESTEHHPTLPSRMHQHWFLGEMTSGSVTGESYVLSFPVNGEILYPLPTENLCENG